MSKLAIRCANTQPRTRKAYGGSVRRRLFDDVVVQIRPRLFVNIFCPPAFPSKDAFPVKIFIHGGYALAPYTLSPSVDTLICRQLSPIRLPSWTWCTSTICCCRKIRGLG